MLNLSIERMSNLSIEELKSVLNACEISERDFAMKLWAQIHEREHLIHNLDGVINVARANADNESEIEAVVCRNQFASDIRILNNINQHFEHHLKHANYRATKSAAARLIERTIGKRKS